MSKQALIERFFEVLISGDRPGARAIIDECIDADAPADQIIEQLFWPTLNQIEQLYRNDQLSVLSHNCATRLLRMLADQMQIRLPMAESNGKSVLFLCGLNEPNELAGQMAVDLLEAAGYNVTFAGGGVANDEIVSTLSQTEPDALVLFSSVPQDLPNIRVLIDQLHDMGVCPQLQIVVGGGVFNRAEGLAEEIGADIWADSPVNLVQTLDTQAERRMGADQRTVGRRRRQTRAA